MSEIRVKSSEGGWRRWRETVRRWEGVGRMKVRIRVWGLRRVPKGFVGGRGRREEEEDISREESDRGGRIIMIRGLLYRVLKDLEMFGWPGTEYRTGKLGKSFVRQDGTTATTRGWRKNTTCEKEAIE